MHVSSILLNPHLQSQASSVSPAIKPNISKANGTLPVWRDVIATCSASGVSCRKGARRVEGRQRIVWDNSRKGS
jgi:hypothetical protein